MLKIIKKSFVYFIRKRLASEREKISLKEKEIEKLTKERLITAVADKKRTAFFLGRK